MTDMLSSALEEVERRHISTVLDRCAWNKHRAARELEISKSTLYSKISKYRLEKQAVDTRAARQEQEPAKLQ